MGYALAEIWIRASQGGPSCSPTRVYRMQSELPGCIARFEESHRSSIWRERSDSEVAAESGSFAGSSADSISPIQGWALFLLVTQGGAPVGRCALGWPMTALQAFGLSRRLPRCPFF